MAERPAPTNFKIVLRLVACVYLLVLSVQMGGRLKETEGTMRYVMIAAIILFVGFSVVAIFGTLRRFNAMKKRAERERAERQAAGDQEPARPEEAAAEPEVPAPSAAPADADELPDHFDLEQQLQEIERLAEAGELEAMERLSEKVKRALARQEAEEQEP